MASSIDAQLFFSRFALGTQLHPAHISLDYILLLCLYLNAPGASWWGGDDTRQTCPPLTHYGQGMRMHTQTGVVCFHLMQ